MRVAVVIQRYGLEVNGGAELHCRLVAEHMAKHWDLEVLTTCAIDYTTWTDVYPPGVSEINGVRVRRFRVDYPRTLSLFGHLHDAVFSDRNCPELEERWIREQGPHSSDFLRYLDEEGDRYDLFVFFTYLYGLTFFGLPKVADRAILVPTAHDEPPFYLSIFQPLLKQPRAFLFNTPEEEELVRARVGSPVSGEVVGLGIDLPGAVDPEPFVTRHRPRLPKPYMLYLGRIDQPKGCRELFEYFIRYCSEHPSRDLQLALVGQAIIDIPHHPSIVHLGFLEEEEKLMALAGAELLVMPSPFESLSMVMLEAWSVGTPVLANAQCKVLEGQCQRSGGGFVYDDYSSFKRELDRLMDDSALRQELGARGRTFVTDRYAWDQVEQAYLKWGERVAGGVRVG